MINLWAAAVSLFESLFILSLKLANIKNLHVL